MTAGGRKFMREWSREKKNIVFVQGILLLFLSAPLFMDYMLAGNRLGICFLENEGIRGPFLWLPVLLHRAGLSIQGCLKLYLFAVNLASLVTARYCFTKITGNSYAGLAGSFCYSFSIYSIYIRYVRASLGEATAFLFLPIVALGMYGLYAEQADKRGYVRNGLILSAGLMGTYLASFPIAVIVSGFVVLAALILWKKTFRKQTLITLLVSAASVLLLSSWLLYPYIQHMFAGGVYADTATGGSFAARSLLPAQVLLPFVGASVYDADIQVYKEYASLGLPFLLILAAWCVAFSDGRIAMKQKKQMKVVLALSLLAVLFCTKLFPWGAIAGLHWLPNAMLEHIGYPYRFLAVAVLLLSMAVSIFGSMVWEKGKKAMAVFLLTVTVVNVLSGVYLMDAVLYTTGQSHSYEADAAHQEAEYLFYMSE